VTASSGGCARCSTTHQTTDAQVAALKAAGCAVVFQETISTRTAEKDRSQLQAALNALVDGDELVVAKLDRLGAAGIQPVDRCRSRQGGNPAAATSQTCIAAPRDAGCRLW